MNTFDLRGLSSLQCECEAGIAIAVECRPEQSRTLGGSSFFRFFWCSNEGGWSELPLKVDFMSLWSRVLLIWPPEWVIKMDCDSSAVTLLFLDVVTPEEDVTRLREARFDFKEGVWSVRTIREINLLSRRSPVGACIEAPFSRRTGLA